MLLISCNFATIMHAQEQTAPRYTGYLAAYFDKSEGGEGAPPESLHLAISRCGFHFTALNDTKLVLGSTLGDKRMRDPMILRDQKGGFHLVVTNSWDKRPFTVWDSNDLIHWANERLVTPSDPDLHPTWAPELGYDTKSGLYFAFWTGVKGDWGNTAYIRYMTTSDFQTWSEPKTFFQKIVDGKNVPTMDASLFEAKGKFHLVYRANDQIWQITSSGGALGPFDTDDHMIMKIGGEGPFVYQLNGQNQWNMVFDYFGGNQGKWGLATSTDARNWTLVTDPNPPYYQNGGALFPEGVRHGAVLSITESEYQALTKAYSNGAP
ncbi:hypothetical protein IAD21_04015 [Abditibacteriota bacterium]|nr:hypothetical protein IAD21_04015 [Abditibacteriota bacterium]